MHSKVPANCYCLPIKQRTTVCESIYVEHLNTTVRLLNALPDDLSLILDYLINEHFDENTELFEQKVSVEKLQESLRNQQVILVTDCFELCGILAASTTSESLHNSDGSLNIDLFEVHNDYSKDAFLHKRMLIEFLKQSRANDYSSTVLNAQNSQIKNAALQIGFVATGTNGNQLLEIKLKELDKNVFNAKPQLPNAYKLDKNETRRQLGSFYVKRLEKDIRFEVALPSDVPVVRQYLLNEFMRQTPLTKTLQFSKQTIQELFDHRFDEQLFHDQLVSLATDDGKICGVCTFKPVCIQKGERKVLSTDVPSDFQKEVELLNAGDSSAAKCHAVALWIMQFVPQFLPPESERYLRVEMVSIHPDYSGHGLSRRFGVFNLEQIVEKGYRYLQFLNVAAASNGMLKNAGGLNAVSVPFAQLKYKKQPIFPYKQLCDGGERMNLVILDLLNCAATN
ncbi:N-acetyltransferase domain-containing protein [Aphelenchoides bicaudatus]|nr:N-acetyltransferase domain-containing protein [Aphelenchoides bicaudatus]